MENPDNTHILANITTLEEAKQELSRLLEFQKKAYYFLRVFCNYDIREPLLQANGLAEVLQEDIHQHHSASWENLLDNHDRINRISIIAMRAASIEEDREKRPEFLKTYYPSETLDLHSILEENIQWLKENIERQNRRYTRADEKHEAIQVKVKLADNLPTARCNSSMLVEVLSDLAWFMADIQNLKTEVSVITDFDEQWVKVILGCTSLDPHRYVFALREFERFSIEPTFFSFHPLTLFLYNSWYTLKVYDGLLDFSVQDNTEIRKPSIAEATVYLKR
jgi:hypothetical protein